MLKWANLALGCYSLFSNEAELPELTPNNSDCNVECLSKFMGRMIKTLFKTYDLKMTVYLGKI